jgi:hypothetical protein
MGPQVSDTAGKNGTPVKTRSRRRGNDFVKSRCALGSTHGSSVKRRPNPARTARSQCEEAEGDESRVVAAAWNAAAECAGQSPPPVRATGGHARRAPHADERT